MKRNLNIVMLLLVSFVMAQCSKNGKNVAEPKFGNYRFSTFTVDSFRFKVTLGGEMLTDSLMSPVGNFSKQVSFFETQARLQIIDAKNNNQLILDSIVQLKTGDSEFPLIQLQKGLKPSIPGPPNETPPAAGNYKIRFQYVSPEGGTVVPYFEPVKCVVLNNNNITNGFLSIDTVVLNRGGLTGFYEAPSDKRFRIRLLQLNNSVITSPTSSIEFLGNTPAGFSTAVMRGIGGTASPYIFQVRKIY